MYEDSTRVGTTTATRQIPVSELLARHRGEQFPTRQVWEEPSPCETTDVIPAVQDDYYLDEPYPSTGYSEAYEYVEERAEDERPFVAVSADTDQFPMPVLDNPHAPEEQTLLAPIDVEAMDAERAAAEAIAAEAPTVQAPTVSASCDDTPSREIYIRELLRREGKLPREQRRKQAPKIAAAAAGVAALCGAVAASIVHVQQADTNQNTASGSGVPLTVVDGGGPRGQALDAPLAPRGTEQVTPDNSTAGKSTTTDKQAKPPRVAPYVTASQQAQQHGGATSSSSATPTTTSNPPSSASNTNTPPSDPPTTNPPPPSQTAANPSPSSQPNSSAPPTQTSDSGLIGGLLNPITGLLGG